LPIGCHQSFRNIAQGRRKVILISVILMYFVSATLSSIVALQGIFLMSKILSLKQEVRLYQDSLRLAALILMLAFMYF